MDALLQELRSNDSTTRAKAKERLQSMVWTSDAEVQLLAAAAGKFPEDGSWPSIPVAMIESATKNPSAEHIPVIKKNFAAYNKNAKLAALQALINIDKRESIEAYLQLATEYADKLDGLPANGLSGKTGYATILYPSLLKLISHPAISPEVFLLLLNYLDAKAISPDQVKNNLADLLNAAILYRRQLQDVSTGVEDIWDNDEYLVARRNAGIVADLLGHFKTKEVIDELHQYTLTADRYVVLYGVKSLLRMGEKVDAGILNKVAADAETRNLLYDAMNGLGRDNEFPGAYKTQAAFAESDMVNWLLYPTEMGRKPDAIELMKVFDINVGDADGNALFYLFRFRSSHATWKDDGWMAGVSGYYIKKDTPTTVSNGFTFSGFEKWDAKTADQHFDYLFGLVGKANDKELEDQKNK